MIKYISTFWQYFIQIIVVAYGNDRPMLIWRIVLVRGIGPYPRIGNDRLTVIQCILMMLNVAGGAP